MPEISERRIMNAIQPRIEKMIREEVGKVLAPAAEALQDRIEGRIDRLSQAITEQIDQDDDEDDEEDD